MSEFNLDWQKGYEKGLSVGIDNERNRIIRLTEGEMCEKDEELVECWCGSWLDAVALIKEENSKGKNE